MNAKRKVAHYGLALLAIVLIGCLAVLFFQDRAARAEGTMDGPVVASQR